VLKVASDTKKKKTDTVSGLQPDTLNMRQLRKINERVFQILGQDPEIQELFDKAYAGDYEGPNGKTLFWNDMENMEWWSNNSDALKDYIVLSADPDNPDYINLKQDSYEYVRATSRQLGMNLSDEQITDLAEETLMYGWGRAGQEYRLRDKILSMESQGRYGGDIYANAETLRQYAAMNGVYYDDTWFDAAGKSIAGDATDYNYWEDQIKEQAMQKYGAFAQQIQAGQNVRAIASPYLQAMAETWELAPDSIRLDDPTLLSAMAGFDANGNPQAMNLGEFARKLREDPRWLETDKAQNEITGIAGRVMQMFGVMGG
jgi:hypothetical protein